MIIGLAGYARVGKNTLASMIVNEPDASMKMVQGAFADRLKKEVGDMLTAVKIPRSVLTNDKENYRDLMVFWGRTRRRQNPDYWVDIVMNQYRKLKESSKGNDFLFIITDVRYMNEVEAILKEGGKVYIVQRELTGPANKEEADSLKEIYDYAETNPGKVVVLPPADALDMLQEYAIDIFDEVYQELKMKG